MSLQKNVSPDSNTVTLVIDGMFDLSIQSEFRTAYESESSTAKYILDLRSTDYMDSAAFGMLLVFRDYAGGDKSEIFIKNANDDIKKTFVMLQFDRMFKIE